jgi:hypothetical protein
MYPDAFKEVVANIPKTKFNKLAITVFVDSDHAHNMVMRRSVSGILIMVG